MSLKTDVILAAVASVVLSACVTAATKHHLGPAPEAGLIECRAEKCPSVDDLRFLEQRFREVFHSTASGDPPRTLWHATDPFIDSYGRSVHGAHGPGFIEAPTVSAWVHERLHLELAARGLVSGHDKAGNWRAGSQYLRLERALIAEARGKLGAP